MSRYVAAIYRTKDRPLCVAGHFGHTPHLVSDGPTLRSFLRHLPPTYDLLSWSGLGMPEERSMAESTGARAIFSYSGVQVPLLDPREHELFAALYDTLPLKPYDRSDVLRLWWLWRSGACLAPTAYEHILAV